MIIFSTSSPASLVSDIVLTSFYQDCPGFLFHVKMLDSLYLFLYKRFAYYVNLWIYTPSNLQVKAESSLKIYLTYSLLIFICSPSRKINDCSNVTSIPSAICFNSSKITVSHFSFLLKFCGI